MEDLSKKSRFDVLPWIEKYRPQSLDGIISHKTVVENLKKTISDNKLQHLLFHGPSGTGKCLDPMTPVLMFNGEIKIAKNIVPGDLLMGDDNSARTVLNTTSGKDIMYTIIQENGDTYKVNSEHILYLMKRVPKRYKKFFSEGKFKIDDSKFLENGFCELTVRELYNYPNFIKKWFFGVRSSCITCWNKINVEIDPYLMGRWLRNNNTDIDLKLLEKYGLSIDNKFVHRDFMINDVNSRMALLAGYFDEEVEIYDNSLNVKGKNSVTDSLSFVARSLGLKVGYRCNIFFIKGNSVNNLPFKNIYGNVIKIKKNEINSHHINVYRLYLGDYFGFELDGNRRFLLGDFTITHNTSSIMACARELYGTKMDLMTLNINASEERGIEVVRNRIQQFVNAKIIHSVKGRSMFKMVILDEADAMTADAQAMLRKVIEKFSYCTRFCLICNYIKKITPALQSRCACYRFPPLKDIEVKTKILQVATKENIKINDSGIMTIIKRSKGDMRKVLNILQSTSMSYDNINENVINKCLGYPNTKDITLIMKTLLNENFEKCANVIGDLKISNSYSLQDILTEISNELIGIVINGNFDKYGKKLTPEKIIKILKKLSVIEYNLTTCVTESLQMMAIIGIFKLIV